MRVGVISGSATYDWPTLTDPVRRSITTRYGREQVSEGRVGEMRCAAGADGAQREIFADVVEAVLLRLAKAGALAPAGIIYRLPS